MFKKLAVSAIAALSVAMSGVVAADAQLPFEKGDVIVTDFGRIVSASDLDRSLRKIGGRVLSPIRGGSINGHRTLILGPDKNKYFIKVSALSGTVIWIAPAQPSLVARYKG